MLTNRKGFTLIELLIVVVIIGILAAIAIPKFAATKDKAKLASVKTDVRNVETAEEAYFSDYATYGSFAQLQTASNYSLSTGNTMVITPATNGYTIGANNSSISSSITSCKVQVAAGATSGVDGKITCP
jgi:type IV pilus assembly protein PilA